MNRDELIKGLKALNISLTCSDCRHFAWLYWKDGTCASMGKCRNKNVKRKNQVTTGKYGWNRCDAFDLREVNIT